MLVEPLGLLEGRAAADAVAAGFALPLAGGPAAFTHARALATAAAAPFRVGNRPPDCADALARLTAPPPPWAGLPADRALVMGIVNVTPDSFSDGGDHLDPDRAIAAGLAMAAEGADILDVGGESTRPGSAPVPPEEERRRILPVIG